MELLNYTVLGIVMVIVVAAALILITAMTGQVKDKGGNKPSSTNNSKIE